MIVGTPSNLAPGITRQASEGARECPHQYANGADAIKTIYGGGFYCPICHETFEDLPDEVAPVHRYAGNPRYQHKYGRILG